MRRGVSPSGYRQGVYRGAWVTRGGFVSTNRWRPPWLRVRRRSRQCRLRRLEGCVRCWRSFRHPGRLGIRPTQSIAIPISPVVQLLSTLGTAQIVPMGLVAGTSEALRLVRPTLLPAAPFLGVFAGWGRCGDAFRRGSLTGQLAPSGVVGPGSSHRSGG